MPTLIYTPQVRVFIKTAQGNVVDVSEDLVNGQLVRRSDGVSMFNFSLQNARRKYDNMFTPNDRIIVQMKRFTWLRVFSGYLNSVPLFSVWPRVVSLASSCSLKRLQYWWWDPSLPNSEQLVRMSLLASQGLVAPTHPGKENSHTQADSGTKNVLLAVLDRVVGWPNDKVHISKIPDKWFEWAVKVAQQMQESTADTRAAIAALQAQVGSNGTVGGTTMGGTANGVIKPGTVYGGSTFDDKQCPHIEQIFNALASMRATRDEVIITFMVAQQESTFLMWANKNIPESMAISHEREGSDHYSVGLFQQQTGPFGTYWGTVQQCMDPAASTKRFLQELRSKVGNRISSQPKTVSAQHVQGSAYPDAYAKWESSATALTDALMRASGSPNSPSVDPNATPRLQGLTGDRQGQITGAQLAQRGVDLVRKDRPGPTESGAVVSSNIPYRMGNDSPPESPPAKITALDCSSFVAWCYFQASGGGRAPRSSQDQAKWCRDQGSGLKTPASDGLRILGALMFNGGADAHHVGISLGDGMHTVEASHTGSNVHVITNTQWDSYGLPPGVNYVGMVNGSIDFGGGGSGSPAGEASVTQSALAGIKLSDSPANSTDPIDELFSGAGLRVYGAADAETSSTTFQGGLALANDLPLLPWLKNVVNSSMRSFSSGPNGDFISWFPDYYGLWGTAAVVKIEPVELIDFTVDWSDDNLVTHQFVQRATSAGFDLTQGSLTSDSLLPATQSAVISIDMPAVMQALFGQDSTDEETARYTDFIYKRFGARPDLQQATGITGDKGQFFLALYLFMQRWTYQYNADVPITFMPELWPGMLLQIPDFSFQAYVTTVTHTFDFSDGGGFSTTANIAAPARLNDSNGALMGLPIAAGAGIAKSAKPPTFAAKKAAHDAQTMVRT